MLSRFAIWVALLVDIDTLIDGVAIGSVGKPSGNGDWDEIVVQLKKAV